MHNDDRLPGGREEVNAVAVRVYCGVATAEHEPWLTVAVVDDSARVIDMRHISDDPSGYAQLVASLAARTPECPVALDHHEHIVAQLLAAAGSPLTVTDEPNLRNLTERLADSPEEKQAPLSQRQAITLARALQAGVFRASVQSPSWDLDELKPVLSAHAALIAGRQGAAFALREVLQHLYPAALRAYLDPAELIPLKVLEAFPEPSLLSSAQAVQAVVSELAATGVTDAATAASAVAALRAAVDDERVFISPNLAPAVAQAVQHAISSLSACDAAANALVESLVERLTALLGGGPSYGGHAAAPVSPAIPRPTSPAVPSPRPEAYVPGRSDFTEYAGVAALSSSAGGVTPSGAVPGGSVPGPVNGGRSRGWEQQFGPAPSPVSAPRPQSYGPDTLSFSMDPLTAPLDPTPPGGEDLLIFSEANSVWFTNGNDDTVAWANLVPDDGWKAASADPSVGPDTTAGLPRRVPQANLVPGSVTPPRRSARIVRDPRRIAAQTEGYFRGWRRGQEVGGFAVSGRERGAWEFNREERARQGAARLS